MKNLKILLFPILFIVFCNLQAQQYSVVGDTGYNSIYDLKPYCIADDGSIYKYLAPKKIAKYSPNGYLDVNFGVNGVATIPNDKISVMKFYNNSIYVIISNRDDDYLSKYSTAGIQDTSFGNNGTVLLDTFVVDCMVNSDGSIYITGYGKVKKLLPNGSYDTNFAMIDTGYQFTEFKRTVDNSLIYIIKSGSNTIIKKNLSTGAADLTFGSNGSLTFSTDVAPKDIFVNKVNEMFLVLNNYKTIRKLTQTGITDNNFGNNGDFTIDYIELSQDPFDPDNPYDYGPSKIVINFDTNNNLFAFVDVSRRSYKYVAILKIFANGQRDDAFSKGKYFSIRGFGGGNFDSGNLLEHKLISDNEYLMIIQVIYGLAGYKAQSFKLKRIDLLSVNDITNDNVSVYPNPATDVITVVLKKNEVIENSNIYTMDGKLLTVVKDKNIDLSDLSAGNYILEIVTNKGVARKKIIKK